MFRKLLVLVFLICIAAPMTACSENEYKTTTETQEQRESAPRDSSPGTMIVE